MSAQHDDKTEMVKNENLWPIRCDLTAKEVSSGRWSTTQWSLNGFKLLSSTQDNNSDSTPCVALELFKDERTDYRFNLSSKSPKLFLVMENLDDSLNQNILNQNIVTLTASQSVAGQYMDGDYLVLSHEMPLPVQAWMEAFIGRHGELIEQRRKKRRGAGRSSGK
ncbi:DUF3305 domain-containing protein [Vibrio amylolyticus]|uniref:DUF3305 domain-containing protein n=1 Tax=Vibrio amylolyticus TaxID=2847292 RepID=UPI00354D61AA